MNLFYKVLGLSGLSRIEKGYFLIYLVTFVPLIYKFISPFFIISGLGSLTVIINPIIFIVGLILAFADIKKRIRSTDVIFYFLVIILIFFSSLINSDVSDFFADNAWNFISGVLPYIFIGLTLDYRKHRAILKSVAKLGILVQVFLQTLMLLGLVEHENYGVDDTLGEQMGFAYALLFPTVYILSEAMDEKRFDSILYSIIGVLLLLFMGTRGPIVVLAAFIVINLLVLQKSKNYGIIVKGIVFVLFILLYLYIDVILEFMLPITLALGFSTRIFNSLLNNEMVSMDASSGREDFYGAVWRAIENDHGFGYGWGSDRLFTPDGGYAHNFELEILCQFGLIGGGVLLLLLLLLIIRSCIASSRKSNIMLWVIMLCTGFLSLQLSGSYITTPLFFIMVGYMTGIKRAVNNEQLNQNQNAGKYK